VSVSTTSAPSLCVVICCYTDDRWDLLVRSIEAALQQVNERDELLVVVDHNPPLRERLARHLSDPRVRLLGNAEGPGLSGARNTGLGAAAGDVIVFLDDDAVILGGALAVLRARFSDPAVTAIGGAVHPDWTTGAPGWFPAEFGWVVGCDYRGLPGDGGALRNPIGAAMAVRRDPLAAIGGFSAQLGRTGTFPAGCEETLMGIALRREDPQAGIVRETGFAVRHCVPAERGTWRYFTRRCYQEGRSKAVLAGLSSTGEALSSERAYALRVLTSGLWRYRTHPAAAAAVVVGFACTAAGFIAGTLTSLHHRQSAATPHREDLK